MTESYHIVGKELPISLNFKKLKDEGLAYIQDFDGVQWTNLNPSDPGVTILDQLIFALTEIGYCTNFSIKDVLTHKDGEIKIKHQFYETDDILTTSPVSAYDYIKYLCGKMIAIQNAELRYDPVPLPNVSIGAVYLKIDRSTYSSIQIPGICNEAYFMLNRARNLGSVFSLPKPFELLTVSLLGSVEIEAQANEKVVNEQIQDAIDQYIYPIIEETGYDELVKQGIETNTIFNGPKLKNGWIVSGFDVEKRNTLKIQELIQVLHEVSGVLSVPNLAFESLSDPEFTITSSDRELLSIHLDLSYIKRGETQPKSLGDASISELVDISAIETIGDTMQEVRKVNTIVVKPKIPKGEYRNISEYYSIQNTFPEIFAVGENAINSNDSSLTIAQTRQLKGYLTLIDQTLSNQFAQLAALDRLLSFKNSSTASPSELKSYKDHRTQFEKDYPPYPIPFISFSPTYFFNTLYDVPNIRPLLKDNNAFRFSNELLSDKELENQSWKEFKKDPYNNYVAGLMKYIEEEEMALDRRNDILDHLLARHGESPYLLNQLIRDSVLTKEIKKDRIIFKSLYLQNLKHLSYNRYKGYNYLQAEQVNPVIPELSEDDVIAINNFFKKDFVVASKDLDEEYALHEQDFVNYSGLENKLNLLLGLDFYYRRFIVSNYYSDQRNMHQIGLAQWMRTERKGCILVESKLLLADATYQLYFKSHTDPGACWQTAGAYKMKDIAVLYSWFSTEISPLHGLSGSVKKEISDGVYTFEKVDNFTTGSEEFQKVGTNGTLAVKATWGNIEAFPLTSPIFSKSLHIILPEFIPAFMEPLFKDRLDLFLGSTLPVGIDYTIHRVKATRLNTVVKCFAEWHNAKKYQATPLSLESVKEITRDFVSQLIELKDA